MEEQLKTTIVDFPDTNYLYAHMDRDKRNVIGYFKDRNSIEYQNFLVCKKYFYIKTQKNIFLENCCIIERRLYILFCS